MSISQSHIVLANLHTTIYCIAISEKWPFDPVCIGNKKDAGYLRGDKEILGMM